MEELRAELAGAFIAGELGLPADIPAACLRSSLIKARAEFAKLNPAADRLKRAAPP